MRKPHSFSPTFWLPLFVVLISPNTFAAVKYSTFDDTDSSFTFTGNWNAISPSNPCNGCASKPDTTQIFDGTWHDGNTLGTGGSFTFTGSAVWIFGIDQVGAQPNIDFTLPTSTGTISTTHHYTGNARFAYNATFFSASGLDQSTSHTVSWIFNANPQSQSFGGPEALFDYAIVQNGVADASNPGTGSSATTGGSPSDSGSSGAGTTTTTVTSSPTVNPDTNNSPNSSPNSSIANSAPSASQTKVAPASAIQSVAGSAAASKPSVTNSMSTSLSETSSSSIDPPSSSNRAHSTTLTSSESAVTSSKQTSNSAPSQLSARSKPNLAMILGGVLGGVTFGGLVMLVLLSRRRRRMIKDGKTAAAPYAFEQGNNRLSSAEGPAPLGEKSARLLRNLGSSSHGPNSAALLPDSAPHSGDNGSARTATTAEPSVYSTASASTATRERVLEDRVAELEARIMSVGQPRAENRMSMTSTALAPPPYVREGDD